MDYKDLGVVGLAILGGGAGGALAGPVGVVGGVVAGSAVGAKWASESDAVRELRQRVAELEGEGEAAHDADTGDVESEPAGAEAVVPAEDDHEPTATDDEPSNTTTESATETIYK